MPWLASAWPLGFALFEATGLGLGGLFTKAPDDIGVQREFAGADYR